jgi:hypothetical protein
MNAPHKKTPEHMERIFAQAHRLRRDAAVGDDWAYGIMRAVRREAAEQPYSVMLDWAEPLIWRAAVMAVLVAMLFAGSVVAYSSQQSNPVTALWLEEFDAGSPL